VKQPEDVQLSRAEGEALIERLERNTLSAADRQLLVKVLTFYFWLLFALREAKLSLKRLKALGFGEKPTPPSLPPQTGHRVAGVAAGVNCRRVLHRECSLLDQLPRLRRSRRRRGLDGMGPTSIGRHRRWSVGMRN
jgi:hypothetical protein